MIEKLKKQIKNYDRETLENKFISLFQKLQSNKNNIDFSDYKVKRRQQYLHKTYTNKVNSLNAILKLAIETQDENLLNYLSKINKELEKKAKENQDLPK